MDKELEEAQELTRDDLIAKLRIGRPANLAPGPRGSHQTAPVGGFELLIGFSEVKVENVHFASDVILIDDSSRVRISA